MWWRPTRPKKGVRSADNNSQKRSTNMTDTTQTHSSGQLKALANSHGRSFAEAVEHFTRHASGAELGVRSSVAADLVQRVGRPRTPPAARTSAAPLSGPRRSGTRSVQSSDGLALLERLDATRVDQSMTEEQTRPGVRRRADSGARAPARG